MNTFYYVHFFSRLSIASHPIKWSFDINLFSYKHYTGPLTKKWFSKNMIRLPKPSETLYKYSLFLLFIRKKSCFWWHYSFISYNWKCHSHSVFFVYSDMYHYNVRIRLLLSLKWIHPAFLNNIAGKTLLLLILYSLHCLYNKNNLVNLAQFSASHWIIN